MRGSVDALVVVAHPDDETLWAGGTMIQEHRWSWTVASLCRGADPDRAPRFARVMEALGATGVMSDLDDGPDQAPLPEAEVESSVLALVPPRRWNVVFTHSPFGEYTRHRRHEEIGRAVIALWERGAISARQLRLFAYEDGGRAYPPRAVERAHLVTRLDDDTFATKYHLVTDIYGFAPDSWEAQATPSVEAFWRFDDPAAAAAWTASESVAQRGSQ